MKTALGYLTWCFVFVTGFAVAAKAEPLQYQFTTGQTNVYSVEISLQGETGTESTTGLVFVVTEGVNTNAAKISCRMDLRQQMRRQPRSIPGMYYGGMVNNFFPNRCEISLNPRGQELRDAGDLVLAAPLGKMTQSIFEPLPGKGETETVTTVAIMGEPVWLGPAEDFRNSRMNGYPPYYSGYRPQDMPGLLYLTRKSAVKFSKGGRDSNNLVAWHKHSEFESGLKRGGEPEFSAKTESDFTFDRNVGCLTQIDTEGDAVSQTETSSRKVKVSFKARRLAGDELVAALTPPVPTPPRMLSVPDLDKVAKDLKSDDLETRRAAVRQLNGVKVEKPSDELVNGVAAMALDGDMSVQTSASSFLEDYATATQVPVLLKLLRSSDWSRQGAVKALGRLKVPATIQPLVDVLAANRNMSQAELNNALIQFGPVAEPAVLALLTEKNTETRRQVCAILQQIGTTNSLPGLLNLVGDPDQSLSQAAADAVRDIKKRQ